MKPWSAGGRWLVRLVVAGFGALILVAGAGAMSVGGKGASGKHVYLIGCEPNVYCHAYNQNMTKKLRAAGVSVTLLSDNLDPAVQNQHMNQAIAQKPDAILVFASNTDAIVPALQRAEAAGIPTVNLNGRLKPAGLAHTAFQVVSDNAALGRFAAINLVEGMKRAGYKSGRVIVIEGTAGTLTVQDRVNAFKTYMKKYPQYTVAAIEDSNWDPVKTSQLALQLFTKYRAQGGVQGAYGMADYMAVGIIQAAKQLGLRVGLQAKGVIVTGSNCSPAGVPALKAGTLYGDATQSPVVESSVAAQHVIAWLNGKKQPKTVLTTEQRFTQFTYQKFVSVCAKW